jgi:hypothetical protein
MTYVGNPIDTTNTFQSIVGKRFSGDGSTTAFTLDVAPSSTLDIEVFVGNVRQDPNSAYTLSGTTLTFTGAPPSGTNNIYVVHQAKSVGTITPGANSVGVTELNLSDGSSGQFIKTDGSGTLSFASVSSPITALNNATENELVTVGSTTTELDAEAKLISDGSGIIIRNAAVGTATAGKADMLVIEGNASGDTAGMSILTANDEYGVIHFGDDGDVDIGKIEYYHGSNYMRFYTNAAERMRLLSDGTVLVGTATDLDMDDTNNGIKFAGASDLVQISRNNNAALGLQRTGNDGRVAQFYRDTTERGYIEVDGSSTTYATSSDYRLKENIVDLDNGITRLKQLKPRRFNFIGEEDTRDGFVAHEVTAVPEAVSGEKDAVDENGKAIHQGIDQSKIVPLLTAALQEAVTKIEALEARVKALEEA